MNRLFIILFLIMLGTNTICIQAGNDVKLSQEEKAIIKKLKSTYKPKSIDFKIGSDGFKYFELITKTGTHFVADSVGTVIIDPKYEYSYIIYVPKAETSKRDYFHNKWGDTQEILSVPVERTFIASRNSWIRYSNGDTKYPSFFYNEHGELITFFAEELEKIGNTLFRVHHTDETTGMYGVYGLISADGKVIIPTEYDFISPSSKYGNLGNWHLSLTNDGIKYWGVFNTRENKIVVPCLFNNVEPTSDGDYVVKLTEYDSSEVYDSTKNYTLEFADQGEKLFYQKSYKGVIAYYAENNVSPLGVALTNISYYRISKDLLEDYNRYLRFVNGDDYSMDFSDRLRGTFVSLKRNLTDWSQYRTPIDLDSIPSKYLKIYEESQDFLYSQYYKIFDYEDEINVAIPSFMDRRRDFRIAQERQRQEKIREEKFRQEQDRIRREREQKRRLAEQKRIAERKKREAEKKKTKNDKSSNTTSNGRNHHIKLSQGVRLYKKVKSALKSPQAHIESY